MPLFEFTALFHQCGNHGSEKHVSVRSTRSQPRRPMSHSRYKQPTREKKSGASKFGVSYVHQSCALYTKGLGRVRYSGRKVLFETTKRSLDCGSRRSVRRARGTFVFVDGMEKFLPSEAKRCQIRTGRMILKVPQPYDLDRVL